MKTWTAEETARKFHEAYERLAPSYGYQTREETKSFDPDSANGFLMVAVCAEILKAFAERLQLDESAHAVGYDSTPPQGDRHG